MERYISLLLTFTSLATAKNSPSLSVARHEIQDSFGERLGSFTIKFNCTVFSGGTATQQEDGFGCICDKYLTFSTENRKCISYKTDEDYYMFHGDGSNDNPVRCVYVTCYHYICIFKSPTTNKELPVVTPNNMLHSNDKCVVNFVEIIHDCIPRLVDLKLNFTAHEGDTNLYLQLFDTIPLTYLRGELFKVDVTCNNKRGKLMFKYNGSTILTNKASFSNIPAYTPSATSCSGLTTTISITSTQTVSQTSSTSIQPTSPLPELGFKYTTYILIGVGIIVTILIFVIIIIVICCCVIFLRNRHYYNRPGLALLR